MAEHLEWKNRIVPGPAVPGIDGFAQMGKPVPIYRRTAGLKTCQDMGLNTEQAWAAVGAVAEQIERDQPYQAQGAAMKFLDLTGAYRLMAVLMTAPDPDAPVPPSAATSRRGIKPRVNVNPNYRRTA